jgi:predicted nucleotidyltransferase
MNREIEEYTKEDENIVKSFEFKDNLSDAIFDEKNKMHEDVRKKLIDISESFIDFLGIEFFIHDIILIGSLANYNWSKYSDIDVHILIDFENSTYSFDLLEEFFDAKKTLWNNLNDIKIKNYDVEMYVQDINDEYHSAGVYSILKNKWLENPTKQSIKIDDVKILNKADEIAKKIDVLIKKFENNKDVNDETLKLYKKIKKFRQTGLSGEGENSYENLTFKLLRRNGYIKKLIDLKNQIRNKDLSIEQ